MEWPEVPLGEVIRHRKEFIEIKPDESYARCRVRTATRGIVLRDNITGAEIKTKRQQVCRAGEFLVAEIDAKMGGYGIVPDSLEGAIVSSHYFLYELDENRILQNYLSWYSKTEHFFDQVNARGSTNYAAIRPSNVLEYQIPLPSLDEQWRIVARLDRIAELIEKRRQAIAASEADLQALLSKAFERAIDDAPLRPMAEVAPLVRRPVEIQLDKNYPELGVRSFGRGTFHKPALPGFQVGTKKLFRIEPGDLVFNNVFAWEGAVAVVRSYDRGRVGSHRFLTCVPAPNTVTANFLHFYFLTREGLQHLGEASPGGAGRNRTLGLKKLEIIEVPVPPIGMQRWFDRLEDKADHIRRIRSEASVAIDTLSSAVIRGAFGGEGHATP